MTTKSPSMRARWLYRVLFTNGRAYRGRHWYDAADWFKARGWPLLLAALLLALSACGAWEDGASGQPTPEGYIWIPATPGTPEPWPTVPPVTPTLPPNVTATEIPWTQTMRAIAPPTPPVTPVDGEAAQ